MILFATAFPPPLLLAANLCQAAFRVSAATRGHVKSLELKFHRSKSTAENRLAAHMAFSQGFLCLIIISNINKSIKGMYAKSIVVMCSCDYMHI